MITPDLEVDNEASGEYLFNIAIKYVPYIDCSYM